MVDLPAQTPTGLVTGLFGRAIGDTADVGVEPDWVALAGQVTLTPDLVGGRLRVADATPPQTIIVNPVPVELVAGAMSVRVIADPSFTWTATFQLTGVYIAPFTFQPVAGATVDLTVVGPVETGNGGELWIAEAAASAASAAASAVSSQASAVSAAASAALVGAPADVAVAAFVGDPASATSVELMGTYGRKVTGVYYLTDYITGAPDLTGATDYTAELNAAHAAMQAANGGVLMFPAGKLLIAGQVYLPNDGGTIPAPTQKAIKWQGTGGYYNGQNALGVGGTRLVLTYADATYNNAKIITRGLGVFRIEDMVLQDTTAGAITPFLFTTCTTLKISNCAFIGATSGVACAQDAIVLGGTMSYNSGPTGLGYGDPDAPFQGYGTVISGNYFERVRRAVYGRSYVNQVVIADNFFDKGCGTNLVGGACIDLDGAPNITYPDGINAYNVITGNYFEWSGGYYYQVKLTQCAGTFVAGNAGEDPSPGAVAVALVGIFGRTGYPSSGNNIVGSGSGIGPTMYEDALSLDKNTCLANAGADGNKIPGRLQIGAGSLFIPDPAVTSFQWKDTTGAVLLTIGGAGKTWTFKGSVAIDGSALSATTVLTIGLASVVADAVLTFNPHTTKTCQIQFKHAGANSWLFYDAATTSFYFRDSVNAKMHMTFTPGAGTGGTTEANSALKVMGNVGFAGTAPIAKRATTPDATDLATVLTLANAIKADLVAYGLKA